MDIQQHKLQEITSVSVIMCTYNGALFVEQQLQSILAQTFPLKEVLVFDDCSSDDTVDILKRIANENPIIRIHINENNKGYTRNFEQAFLAATGDAIAISDQDDIWMANKIEKMVAAWKPDIPLIYCYSYMFKDIPPLSPKPSSGIRKFEGKDARKLFLYNSISGHTALIRRDLLKLVIPFSEKVTYDWWMAVVAACNGGVQYYPEVLVYQRLHTNNATVHDSKKISAKKVRERHKQEIIDNNMLFATAPNMPEKYRQFALKFAVLAKESLLHSFYKPLFMFLFKHRHILFHIKKRKVVFFSHLKHSYRRTAN